MSDKQSMLRVLGISGSPRNGNSKYLLSMALEAAKEVNDKLVVTELFSFKGKKFEPCNSCFSCAKEKNYGECIIKDDFQELREKWMQADAVIYSVPVYHVSIPGQLKCFIDRLGNSGKKIKDVAAPKFMKSVGAIAQGSHLFGGQELAITFLLHHAVLMNCIPVSGDGWQSYLGAAGWTITKRDRTAIENDFGENERDAEITVQAARTLGMRVTEMALILRQGMNNLQGSFAPDTTYMPILKQINS
ncbi:flavodoxin family protein [Desulfoferula mesophila]|uniref:NAD(FAD)-dependent dehydrogenase n=1 Tax=Desulfoferula mesophila TaxID=3058419 RepID=A0AAU9EIG4_9BACT|nr:NAD(FAD)-dependent dehydrogenase [Desulfoferula mesophilus]